MSKIQSKFWDGYLSTLKRDLRKTFEINKLSSCSVMLEMCFENEVLAKGTGWFWRIPEGIAIVTAWHNFSGFHHTMRMALSRTGGIPNLVRCRYLGINLNSFQSLEIPLYFEETYEPRWFVHPVCGSYYDMAFLKINIQGVQVACINDEVAVSSSPAYPSEDVFAIGFAQGVSMLKFLPVWKRGTIASDPALPVEGHPKFYVDMAGRRGLSGAPVYRVQSGALVEQTESGQSVGFGTKVEFLGIYSGRAADQLPIHSRTGESTDLGFVWKPNIVIEMLDAGVLDEQPEVGKGKIEIEEFWGDPEDTESDDN